MTVRKNNYYGGTFRMYLRFNRGEQKLQKMVNPEQLLYFYFRRLIRHKKAYIIAACSIMLVAAIGISHPEKLKSSHTTLTEGPPHKSDSIILIALRYQGVPYKLGGKNEQGFDCSGFTRYVYRQVGILLNASAQTQYSQGVPINTNELRKGDLVFFKTGSRINHVGIVVEGENGQINFIHAASNGVRIDDLSQHYYQQRFVGAKRLIQT